MRSFSFLNRSDIFVTARCDSYKFVATIFATLRWKRNSQTFPFTRVSRQRLPHRLSRSLNLTDCIAANRAMLTSRFISTGGRRYFERRISLGNDVQVMNLMTNDRKAQVEDRYLMLPTGPLRLQHLIVETIEEIYG